MGAGAFIGKLPAITTWLRGPSSHREVSSASSELRRDGRQEALALMQTMALSKFCMLPNPAGVLDRPSAQGADRRQPRRVRQPLMRKVLIAGLYVTAPGSNQPPINDSTFGDKYGRQHLEEYNYWYPGERSRALMAHVYGERVNETGGEYALFRRDPEIDFTGVEPLNLAADSLVRPGLGWAILRGGPADDRAMIVLDYGPVRGHAHPDKLNILFYAFGRELVTDIGYLGARHHFTPWNASTLPHNEVLIDGEPQRRSAASCSLSRPVSSARASARRRRRPTRRPISTSARWC